MKQIADKTAKTDQKQHRRNCNQWKMTVAWQATVYLKIGQVIMRSSNKSLATTYAMLQCKLALFTSYIVSGKEKNYAVNVGNN